MPFPQQVTVFVDPPSYHIHRDGLFDPAWPLNRDPYLNPYLYVRERLGGAAIATHTADFLLRGERLNRTNVYFSLGIIRNYERLARQGSALLSALFALEVPINAPAMYRQLPHAAPHFPRLCPYADAASLTPFVGARLDFRHFLLPVPFEAPLEEHWRNRDRARLVLINANKRPRLQASELYTERLRALARSYRGPARSKYDMLARNRFAICFENMVLPGWVTEKIYAELSACLDSLGETEVEAYRSRARDYLASEGFRPFRKESFAEHFARPLEEYVGVRA